VNDSGLSRRSLAQAVGISEATIRRWNFTDAMLAEPTVAILTARALIAQHDETAAPIYEAIERIDPLPPPAWLVSIGSSHHVFGSLITTAAALENTKTTVIMSPIGVWAKAQR
jgi:hypothetical protein